jgi:hypothetical protein
MLVESMHIFGQSWYFIPNIWPLSQNKLHRTLPCNICCSESIDLALRRNNGYICFACLQGLIETRNVGGLRLERLCLEVGGEHPAPDHIRLLQDCAEICQTSANFMLRVSDFHGSTCEVCAEDCERFTDDEMMQQCAQSCRSCAESCREMAGRA